MEQERGSMKSRTFDVTVGGVDFSIEKFKMFTASRIGANTIAALSPAIGGIGISVSKTDGEQGLLDQDIEQLLPALGAALAGLDGKKLEGVLKELLTKERNVHFQNEDGRPDTLKDDNIDDVFDSIGDMLTLAIEVIKGNYGSLFSMLGIQSGSRADKPSAQELPLI
jgi:hypothetical protein